MNSSIGEILRRLGCGDCIAAFEAQKISIEQVEFMTDDDFQKVGLCTIGMRLKIKQACRNFLKGNPQSGVVDSVLDKYVQLTSKKKKKTGHNTVRNNLRNQKPTRRIYVGWKHQSKPSGNFKLISASQGGGQQEMDVRKDASYSELVKLTVDRYFPNGYSKWQNLKISDLTYYIGNFTGEPVPTMDGDFTFSKYLAKQGSFPVRLYLHTETINGSELPASTDNQESESDGNESLPSLSDVMGTNTVSTAMADQSAAAATDQPPYSSTAQLSAVQSSSSSENLSFVSADTPTVQLRLPRRNLSLSHRSNPETNLQNSHTERSSFIEIIDSEDEAMEIAILESLKEENSTGPTRKENTAASLEQILNEYQKRAVNEDVRSDIIVFRGRVLDSAFRAITRKSFKPSRQLYVKFSGEMGQDYGGPRREFFRLALKELLNSALFEGQEEEKYFSHDIARLDEGKYRLAGRLVALSVAQDGPGLHCLHPVLYDLMTGLEPDLSLSSVPVELQDMITEVKDVNNDIKRDKFLSKHMDWFIDNGFKDIYRQLLHQKDLLINMMTKHHMYYRTLAEITDFTLGLNDVGNLWEVVKTNAELFKPMFCHKPADLSKELFDGLCQTDFSEVGSNAKTQEDETVYSWEVVLQDIQEEKDPFTLEDLLGFMTGAGQIPLCGFDKKIDIKFYNQELGIKRLPSVSTCGLQIWLPRGIREPSDLLALLNTAVKESQGFHKI